MKQKEPRPHLTPVQREVLQCLAAGAGLSFRSRWGWFFTGEGPHRAGGVNKRTVQALERQGLLTRTRFELSMGDTLADYEISAKGREALAGKG